MGIRYSSFVWDYVKKKYIEVGRPHQSDVYTHELICMFAIARSLACVPQGLSLAVSKPATPPISERNGRSAEIARASAVAAAAASAAAAAAAAEAMQPYVPQLPAWKQQARRADRDVLRNLKLELTTMEEQVNSSTRYYRGVFRFLGSDFGGENSDGTVR